MKSIVKSDSKILLISIIDKFHQSLLLTSNIETCFNIVADSLYIHKNIKSNRQNWCGILKNEHVES